jgi:GPH family glycoside/pentoside/hexuronide:cation symporter
MKEWQKILYSLGSLGTVLPYQMFSVYIQFLYIDILGLSAGLVGAGWALYGIWNAVNDPLAGQWSDRGRTRWGRRIPWIAVCTLPLVLFFVLLWTPPASLIQPARTAPIECAGQVLDLIRPPCLGFALATPLFVWFIGIILIFDLLWTIVALNWTALFPEMYQDEGERATVSGWREAFSLLGLIVGIALPPVLVGERWERRMPVAIGFGALTAMAVLASLLGSKEKPEFSREKGLPLLTALKYTFASRSFRWFVLANIFVNFAFQMLTVSGPFYTKYVLKIDATGQSIFMGAALVGAAPFLVVWTYLTKRYGARRMFIAASLIFAAALASLWFASSFAAAVAAAFLAGAGVSGFLILINLLISDVIDEDELVTGVRREGIYFGINGFLIRFAYTLQGIVTGTVLSLTGYLNPTSAEAAVSQPASALLGIRSLISVVPASGVLLGAWAVYMFPLHGVRLTEVKGRLEAIHREKAARIAS